MRPSTCRRGWKRLHPGRYLGERYQILEMLGRGGMGEVWKAFDLKLRVEVALKALRPEFFKSERRLELLRQEVRAAREVISPNVCRIFDLIEVGRAASWCRWSTSTVHPARRAAGARAARAERSPGHRLAVPGRAGSHPQGRSHPPRHQTRKHHAHPGRARGGDGLRSRPPGDRGRRLGLGHPGLHGAGAGGGADSWMRGPMSTRPAWSSPRW